MKSFIAPMLATLTKKVFSNSDWIFEKKFDGARCIVVKKNKKVTLYSRNHKKMNAAFPELVKAFEDSKEDHFILDGEIVALIKGKSSFSALQTRLNILCEEKAKQRKVPIAFYVFDVLCIKGRQITSLPLLERKAFLKPMKIYSSLVRFTSFRQKEGERFYQEALKKGWEGILAKRKESSYLSKRSKDWLKFKCSLSQEFVICGFTKPSGARIGFGALLVGYYKSGKLQYAGKVGTGYDTAFLRSLSAKLKTMVLKDSAFEEEIKEKNAIFVRPKLVAEIGFTEWTKDGKLRHPTFLGLRMDKAPTKVKKE